MYVVLDLPVAFLHDPTTLGINNATQSRVNCPPSGVLAWCLRLCNQCVYMCLWVCRQSLEQLRESLGLSLEVRPHTVTHIHIHTLKILTQTWFIFMST